MESMRDHAANRVLTPHGTAWGAQAEEEWTDFVEEGGPLGRLLAEQEGELCGPRPQPPLLQARPLAKPLLATGGTSC